MMRWIVPGIPMMWLALSAGSVVQDTGAFDPMTEVRKDFDEIASFVPQPAPKLIITNKNESDGLISHGEITLSEQSIRAAKTREELTGLLAYLVSQAAARAQTVRQDTSPNLTSMLAAGAVIAAGERIDPIDERNAPIEARRNYEWSPRPPSKLGGTERGRTALTIMQHAQTCSGAALALMRRLAGPKDLINGPPIRFVAQQAVRDFGSLAAPPDMSCVER